MDRAARDTGADTVLTLPSPLPTTSPRGRASTLRQPEERDSGPAGDMLVSRHPARLAQIDIDDELPTALC